MNAVVTTILVLFTLTNTALLLLLVSKFYEISSLGVEAKRIASKVIPASFNIAPKGKIHKKSEEDEYWNEQEKKGVKVWKN